jgi:sugar O-acyltransferase (sialic acid O-acetyltransferase NeuD family)
MARLVIFGAGDIAKLAHFYFSRDSAHTVAAFAVDRAFKQTDVFCGLPVCATEELLDLYPPPAHAMFVALSYTGMNHVRADKYAAMKQAGYELVSYVSSRCTYLSDAPPGDNCFILEDNTIQPFVTIGNNVTMWSGNHIGHDSVIDDHCFIASHVVVSGHVRIGARCFVGVNAALRNSITLAPDTLVGAGVSLMKDTSPGQVFLAPRPLLHPKSSRDIKL